MSKFKRKRRGPRKWMEEEILYYFEDAPAVTREIMRKSLENTVTGWKHSLTRLGLPFRMIRDFFKRKPRALGPAKESWFGKMRRKLVYQRRKVSILYHRWRQRRKRRKRPVYGPAREGWRSKFKRKLAYQLRKARVLIRKALHKSSDRTDTIIGAITIAIVFVGLAIGYNLIATPTLHWVTALPWKHIGLGTLLLVVGVTIWLLRKNRYTLFAADGLKTALVVIGVVLVLLLIVFIGIGYHNYNNVKVVEVPVTPEGVAVTSVLVPVAAPLPVPVVVTDTFTVVLHAGEEDTMRVPSTSTLGVWRDTLKVVLRREDDGPTPVLIYTDTSTTQSALFVCRWRPMSEKTPAGCGRS